MTQIEQKLIEATYVEVFINGYDRANTTTILKNAKVNKGSMYHYFRDKKALVLSMIEHKLLPIVEKIYTQDIDKYDFDTLFKLIKNSELIVQKHGSMMTNLSIEMSGLDDDFKKLLAKIDMIRLYRFTTILKKLEEDNIIYHEDIEKLAKYIISSIDGATLSYKKSNNISDFFDSVGQSIEYIKKLKVNNG